MRLLLIILISICSLSLICQSETDEDTIQRYIYCLDSYVRATSQEFELPDENNQFLVKKLIVTLYLKEGELVAFNQIGIGFESKIGKKTTMPLLNASCIDTFTKAKEKKIRKRQKIVRVYEYFLQGPKKKFWPEDRHKLVEKYYNQEVENELEKLKKGGEILDISYKLMSVGYPKF